MNNEIEEEEDDFFVQDISRKEADKYSYQRIESRKIAKAFLDEDSNPLWNKLFTWEAIARKAGYLVMEKHGNRETLSGVSHWYLGRNVIRALSRCKNLFSEIKLPIVGENYIYSVSGFDSFIGTHNKRLYGFTTDKTLHAINVQRMIKNIVRNEINFSNEMKYYKQLGMINDKQTTRLENNNEILKTTLGGLYSMLHDVAMTL